MTLITNLEELAKFDFKPEQIFQAENMLICCKLINDKLCLVDVRGYGGPIEEGQHNLLKFALECERNIEVIEQPTIEQRLAFALNTSQTEQAHKEGWLLSDCEGEIQLQKEDALDIFKTDEDAHAFVREKANNGSFLHIKVRDFLKTYSPNEYSNVFE